MYVKELCFLQKYILNQLLIKVPFETCSFGGLGLECQIEQNFQKLAGWLEIVNF